MPRSKLKATVEGDVQEALEKYHGEQYIRREGPDYGRRIYIDEVILNYDAKLVPSEEIWAEIHAYAKEYGDGKIDVGRFDFGAPK